MKKIFGLIILFFISEVFIISLFAQDSVKTDQRSEAKSSSDAKNYTRALELYTDLLEKYPGEPEYKYKTGVCLVNLNLNPDKAVSLLSNSDVLEYSTNALYYLGRAFHLHYSFENAIKTYSKFMLKGKKKDIRYFDVERLIEMARNGLELTKTGQLLELIETRTIPVSQLQLTSEINPGGKLMQKPIEFCSKTDIRYNYRPWMFLPSYTEVNEYIYTAGYEQGRKDNKQLFRIKNINHETWGFPEPLNGVINTKFDEEYPYFDAETSTLYFSSKGHSSMGGYDIFKSVYNWNSKTWSSPENMGFPINSPFDDYIYMTGGKNHIASFVSNRNAPQGKAIIYMIKIAQDTSGVRFANVEEIREASVLPAVKKKTEENPVAIIQTKAPQMIEGLESSDPAPVKSRYNNVLTEALLLQLKADSSARLARDFRILSRETPQQNGIRQDYSSEVSKNENEAARFQKLADQKFAEARTLKETDRKMMHANDSVIRFSKEINGIKVYQYQPDNTATVPVAENPSQNTGNQQRASTAVKQDDFKVLVKSPYGDANPIPVGLQTYSGLIYRVQLGVFSKPKPNDAFGGISPVICEKLNGNTILKYYAGVFYSINNVNKALELIRGKGFPDAFVVAFQDGKPITTEKAKEIEFSGFGN